MLLRPSPGRGSRCNGRPANSADAGLLTLSAQGEGSRVRSCTPLNSRSRQYPLKFPYSIDHRTDARDAHTTLQTGGLDQTVTSHNMLQRARARGRVGPRAYQSRQCNRSHTGCGVLTMRSVAIRRALRLTRRPLLWRHPSPSPFP
eukprot:8621725-Pyramimonas_sp.AAC.1